MATQRDYYEVLGVSKDATEKDIKRAFKVLAKKYHPDISKEEGAEEKFKEAQEAYAILSDQQKRSQYDQFGHAAFAQQGGGGYQDFSNFDFSDIFSEIFGGGFGGFGGFGGSSRQDTNAPRRGRDIEQTIILTLKEAVFGTKKDLNYRAEQECKTCHGRGGKNPEDVKTCSVCSGRGKIQQQRRTMLGTMVTETICSTCSGRGKVITNPCSECHGNGRKIYDSVLTITIPKGVEDGAYMRVPQKGEAGVNNGPAGDLYLNIRVREDDFFKRVGNDIRIEIPISYAQAALGAQIDVPTLYGDVSMKIPAGTQNGSVLRAKKKGVQPERGNTGDQLIKIKVTVPKSLTNEQKELIKQLEKIDETREEQKNLFDKIKSVFS